MVSWTALTVAVLLLLIALLILTLIRGLQTNSNSIHKNLVLCVLLAQAVFLISLKSRRVIVQHEVNLKK